MTQMVSFGEWVQDRRNRLGYTRKKFANLVGCAPITIKKIEKDERRPSQEMAELFATHLQIPEVEQEDFVRRARGEFVPSLRTPREMSLTEAQATPTPEETPKHNLPPQVTLFFGRETELVQISSRLSDPACRLLTILGAGGMGKTRLGIEAARAQVANFTDGVVYIALAPIQAEHGSNRLNPLAAAITDGLGISYYGDEPPEQQLLKFLRRKEILFVLDNCEHLLDSSLFVSRLLAAAPDTKVLTTSRERLQLQEEWVFTLQGLPYASEDVAQSVAVQLFAQRAQQIKATFDLQAELAGVLRICQLVEGMPLGLELAAAMVRQLPCDAIAQEIGEEIDFLVASYRNVPERHSSLRAVFAYSWDRLTNAEQLVLQKLSVFRGGFEREAAKAVAVASFRQLSTLVDKSLLQMTPTGRYQIHELLRQFSAEKLAQSPTKEMAAHVDHSRYFLELLSRHSFNIFSEAGSALREALYTHEIDNIRTTLRWILTQAWQPPTTGALYMLWSVFESGGWYLEAEAFFIQFTSHIESRLASSGNVLLPADEDQANVLLVCAYNWRGWIQNRLGKTDKALHSHQLALTHPLPNNPEANRVKGQAFSSYANTLSWQGNLREARVQIDKSLQLQLDSGEGKNQTLYLAGEYAQLDGDFDTAKQIANESMKGDPDGVALISAFNFRTLGNIAIARGNLEQAESFLRRSFEGYGTTNGLMQVVFRLVELGDVYRLQGRLDKAQAHYEEGLEHASNAKLATGEAYSHWGLGNLAATIGNYEAAKYHYRQSKQSANVPPQTPGGVGWVFMATDEHVEARAIFLSELAQYAKLKQTVLTLHTLAGLAHLFAAAGNLERALELMALVLSHASTYHETKAKLQQLRTELVAELPAEFVEDAEKRGHALELWQTAVSLLQENN